MTQLERDYHTAKVCIIAVVVIVVVIVVIVSLQEVFLEIVSYFGENQKLAQPNGIFPVLQRFSSAFKVLLLMKK